MDGFDEALNGTFDVEDQVSRYILRRAEALRAARDGLGSLDSRDDLDAHRRRVRSTLRSRIGGLSDRSAAPPSETTGRSRRDGYAVEHVVIESRPGFRVTANCYVPEADGPHPGVLLLPGHAEPAKADPDNQRACVELALHGFVVLVPDPLGQGERKQYADLVIDGATVSGGGGTFPHCYAGRKCCYAGANLARFMIDDDRRALDYLHRRDDVDPDRIGVAGASGGGTRTIYLAALDDRVDAAVPCCSVSTQYERLKTGARTHAEHAVAGSVAAGLGHGDLLAAIAPRPVCVGAAASDRHFPVEGTRETVDRVREAYRLCDAGSRLSLVVRDRPHCSVYELGDGVFEWLCDRLGDRGYDPHDDLRTVQPAELWCTPEGSVLDAYPDERTIDDLIQSYVAETCPDAGSRPAAGDAERLRRAVVETLSVDREGCDLAPRRVGRTEADGLAVEKVWFRTERDPDAVAAGVLVTDPDSPSNSPAVVTYERGTRELPERGDEVAALAREHGTALVFDPRGVGAVRNRDVPVPSWVDDYHGTYGTEFKLATDALLLDSSLFGMRVYDATRAAEFLRASVGTDRVSFVGEGVGAYRALYAAAVARDVERVVLRDLGPSFFELSTRRDAPYYPSLAAFDVIGDCDVPHVLAALDERGVRVDGADLG